jgi:hypothetical protein
LFNQRIELIFRDAALAEILTNGLEDLIEGFVGEEIPLDERAQVFRRRLTVAPGLLLGGPELGGLEAKIVEGSGAHGYIIPVDLPLLKQWHNRAGAQPIPDRAIMGGWSGE